MKVARIGIIALLALMCGTLTIAKPSLGLQSWTCREMDFHEAVRFAAANGIRDVAFFKRHLDPSDSESVNAEKRAFLKKNGVRAYTFYHGTFSDAEADNREVFQFAKFFDMDFIVIEPKKFTQWEMLDRLAEEYDVKLAIHNHGLDSTYGNPATVKGILLQCSDRVGVCLDVGWVTYAGFDAAHVFRSYGDRVFDIHLKDKRLVGSGIRLSAEGTMLGEGDANLEGVFDAIKETCWSGVMAIETDNQRFAKDPQPFVESAKRFFEEHSGVSVN